MRTIKLVISLSLIILVGFIAYGLFSMPKVGSITSEEFSAERVMKDIEYISKEPHSIEHPVERDRVRDYLFDRLVELGGDPVIYKYDSISSKFGGYFDIANVFCEFEPSSVNKNNTYLLFVAHLDSRFVQQVLDKTVYSYGAADDGYGLGVVLELVSQASKYKKQWIQGVKVLFTDSEEHDLDGIKKALEHNPELFDDVGLVINVEARGVKGPALLFETSQGNDKLLKLYENAVYPYSYSLTTAVYRLLPNFTDFTPLKDEIPGFNFSVIDNLHYYHTDKDNFNNISLASIQHYGSQLEPVVKRYLIDADYRHPDFFKSDNDLIFFSLPGLGLFTFTKTQYLILNIVTYILFGLILFTGLRRIKLSSILKRTGTLLLISLLIVCAGEGIVWILAKITGTQFDLVSTKYISYDYIVIIVSLVLLMIFYLLYHMKKSAVDKRIVLKNLLSALLIMVIFSVVLLIMVGENFFFLIPLMFTLLALIYINSLTSVIAMLLIAWMGFSFLYCLITALSIGSLGIVLLIAFFYMITIISLIDCFLNSSVWRKQCYF